MDTQDKVSLHDIYYDRDSAGYTKVHKYEELADWTRPVKQPVIPDQDHYRFPLFLTCPNCGYYYGDGDECDCG